MDWWPPIKRNRRRAATASHYGEMDHSPLTVAYRHSLVTEALAESATLRSVRAKLTQTIHAAMEGLEVQGTN